MQQAINVRASIATIDIITQERVIERCVIARISSSWHNQCISKEPGWQKAMFPLQTSNPALRLTVECFERTGWESLVMSFQEKDDFFLYERERFLSLNSIIPFIKCNLSFYWKFISSRKNKSNHFHRNICMHNCWSYEHPPFLQ